MDVRFHNKKETHTIRTNTSSTQPKQLTPNLDRKYPLMRQYVRNFCIQFPRDTRRREWRWCRLLGRRPISRCGGTHCFNVMFVCLSIHRLLYCESVRALSVVYTPPISPSHALYLAEDIALAPHVTSKCRSNSQQRPIFAVKCFYKSPALRDTLCLIFDVFSRLMKNNGSACCQMSELSLCLTAEILKETSLGD